MKICGLYPVSIPHVFVLFIFLIPIDPPPCNLASLWIASLVLTNGGLVTPGLGYHQLVYSINAAKQPRCQSVKAQYSYVFSCDQAALRRPLPVCLSACLSVCHTFFTMFLSSYHHEIFSSYYHWQKWCPCMRSRSKVKGQGHTGHKNRRFWPKLGDSGL